LVTGIAHAPTAGDPALVERLIANLLDNAVRYNVPGGRVEISTRVEGDKAIVSIANTGPVIPPEQVHRLFDPFQRLDRTRVDDHHGLGLSIVRAIAVAHDATLTANARPQGGLSIEIHFPLIPFAMPR
jgi:signal transduction histidine kinase